jgi:hypothetical protein
MVRERLRRKAEANAAAKAVSSSAQVPAQVPANTTGPSYTDNELIEEFASILTGGVKKGGNNKKQGKK